MKLGLVGPAVTVSNGIRTAEDAFDLARVLLADGMIDHCILTAADGIVPDLKHVMEIRDEGTGEGAASLLLTTKPEAFSTKPLVQFSSGFKIGSAKPGFAVGAPSGNYDTSAIEQLIGAVGNPAARGISLLKRDGLYSDLAWELAP
jgi:hypothetical protein